MKANDTYGYEICCTLTFTCWATIDIETITNDFSSLNLPNFGSRFDIIEFILLQLVKKVSECRSFVTLVLWSTIIYLWRIL